MFRCFENHTDRLTDHCYVFRGAVNTGILVRNHKALLFDCCDALMEEDLKKLGVVELDRILFTQHRRTHTAGAYQFIERGTEFIVPSQEKHLFDSVEAYWEDEKNRWHLYHSQPGSLVLTRSLPVARVVKEGDFIYWEGSCIKVVDTPGATDGSVSYILEDGGKTVCFCGDAIYGYGQVYDLHSLQKGYGVLDYHGFIGNMNKLGPSLLKLKSFEIDILIPSHGEIIDDPSRSIEMAVANFKRLMDNYRSISSMNYYFPDYFKDAGSDFEKLGTAKCAELPQHIKTVGYTSFVIISETGAALLIDCGHQEVLEELKRLKEEGIIKSIEACWITHYHDDHVDFVDRLVSVYGCQVITTDVVAEVLMNPEGFFLPCLSPNRVSSIKTVSDGHTWNWHEFKLTAFHFPGQTLYHSGLMLEGHGKKIFFSGDSFSPDGVDDYCAGNRNFLREGTGFLKCIEILRNLKPDYITNQHQPLMFECTDTYLDYLEARLKERMEILDSLLPWSSHDFGTDEWWVRAYPYEQEALPGSRIHLEVHFTNHHSKPSAAKAQPVLPEGWKLTEVDATPEAIVPAKTSGKS